MAEVDRCKAYLYGIATVLLWSTVASAFKLSLRYLDYARLLLYALVRSIDGRPWMRRAGAGQSQSLM